MLHFFLEYAVFFVIVIALIAVVLLFTLSRGKRRAPRHDDAVTHETVDHGAPTERPAPAKEPAPVAKPDPAPIAAPVANPDPVPIAALVAQTPTPVAPKPEPAPAAIAKPIVVPAPAAPAAAGNDDLLQMKGVGPKLVARLHELGITSFAQIAGWDDADVARIDGELGNFKGRIRRDNWIDQAKLLAAGDKTAFEAKYGSLGK